MFGLEVNVGEAFDDHTVTVNQLDHYTPFVLPASLLQSNSHCIFME